jgi:Glycosyl transferase family 2
LGHHLGVLARLKLRLPATARRVDWRYADLRDRVESLRAEVAGLRGDVDALRASLAAVEERRLGTHALLARTYEAATAWHGRLERIRADAAYQGPFGGTPLVTVMVPTRDRAGLLVDRALASVRRQTYPAWEAVVVDDGSVDDTVARVAALDDPRIRLLRAERREPLPEDPMQAWMIGGIPAGNTALRAARGAWLARLDDDDELDDDALEVLVRAAQSVRAEVAYGRLRVRFPERGIAAEMGAWPPAPSEFSWIGAVYHAGLATFERDPTCALLGEGADWNLARRLLDAGARFHLVDRYVGTYYPSLRSEGVVETWRARMAWRPLRDEP